MSNTNQASTTEPAVVNLAKQAIDQIDENHQMVVVFIVDEDGRMRADMSQKDFGADRFVDAHALFQDLLIKDVKRIENAIENNDAARVAAKKSSSN